MGSSPIFDIFFVSVFRKDRKFFMSKQFGFTLAEVLIALVIIGTIFAYTVPAVINEQKNRDTALAYQKALNNLNQAYSLYFNSPPSDKATGNSYKYSKVQYGSNGESLDENGNAETDSNPVVKFDLVDDGNRYQIGKENQLDSVYSILSKIIVRYLTTVNIRKVNQTNVEYNTIATDTQSFYDTTSMAYCTKETTPIEYFYTADGMRYCISYNKESNNEKFGEDTYGVIWVDVNGEKGPNEVFQNLDKTGKKAIYTGDTLPITILKDRFVPGHPTKDNFNQAAQELFFNKK